MKYHPFFARVLAAVLALGLLAASLAACETIAPEKGTDDPITSLPEDDPAYKYGMVPQGTPGEDVIYPVYEASTMKYTLERADLKPFHRLLAACEEMYANGAVEDEDRLISMLYELISYVAYYESQYEVACALFHVDASAPGAVENRQNGYKLWQDADDDFWEFWNHVRKNHTPLYDAVEYFMDLEYPDRVIVSEGTDEYQDRLETLNTKASSLPSDTAQQDVLPLYLEFLKTGDALARLREYENYYEYLSEVVYGRTYTKEQRQALREYVKVYIVPAFREYDAKSEQLDSELSLFDYQRAISYSEGDYQTVGDGVLFSYFDVLPVSIGARMKSAFVYDRILYGKGEACDPNPGVIDVGNIPMMYFPPSGADLMAVSHELGHYCQHLAKPDVDFSYDIKELYSSGNSMLLLRYLEGKLDPQAYEAFRIYEIKDGLFQIVMHTIRDEFDEMILSMDNTDELTVEALNAIMEGLIDEYDAHGMTKNSDQRLITYWSTSGITHAAYFLSYTVSGLASMELYRYSVEDFDAAVALYRALLEEPHPSGEALPTFQKHGWTTLLDEVLSFKVEVE